MKTEDKDLIAAAAVAVLAGFAVGCVVILTVGLASAYCWNLFAPQLFGLPTAEWKNGIGFAGFVICVHGLLGSSVKSKTGR